MSTKMHVNTVFQNGVIRGLLLAFQYMGKNNNKNGGVVVNIASIAGLEPNDVAPIYTGIKHGVVGLTKAFGV
jgi:NAD(P)-dependent dehydrogenase (short-subunit alcohol dehydrogenase family)